MAEAEGEARVAEAQVVLVEAKREWRRHERRVAVADERAEAAQLQIEQLASDDSQWKAAEAEEAAGGAMTVEAAANNDCTNYNCGFSKDGLFCWADERGGGG